MIFKGTISINISAIKESIKEYKQLYINDIKTENWKNFLKL